MIRGQHKDLVQPTVKTAPITAALLGMAAYTFAAAELNVAQMLILNDRANNNANTTASVLGESNAGKDNDTNNNETRNRCNNNCSDTYACCYTCNCTTCNTNTCNNCQNEFEC